MLWKLQSSISQSVVPGPAASVSWELAGNAVLGLTSGVGPSVISPPGGADACPA